MIRNRTDLIAHVAANHPVRWLFFWGHTGGKDTKACLSQWFPAPFVVAGERFATAEHWMMAGKAELFGDAEHRAQILDAPSPAAAKALGRKVRGFDKAAWDAAKFGIVADGNVHKFGQDPDLRAFLLATGDRMLVEAAPRDRIWGIGMGANHEHATNPRLWRGQNLLGFALMEARARLRAE
jgi:ribA/ribD-fused uncharacterized protein